MTKPNFLIIGAKKSGTTSLCQYLDEHPNVYMSRVKEPNFFAYLGGRPVCNHPPGLSIPIVEAKTREDARRLVEKEVQVATFTTKEAYEALFENAKEEKGIGEASHTSLYFNKAANRIYDYMPEGKLIAILRNPVDRAYSDYLMLRRDGREPIDNFLTALEAEDWRIEEKFDSAWHYKSHGFYFAQLKRFFNLFPISHIKVILSDDLFNKTEETVKSVYQFLGVDGSFFPHIEKIHGIGGLPQTFIQKLLYQIATKPNKIKETVISLIPNNMQNFIWKSLLKKPQLHPMIRAKIIEIYRSDIEKLQDLIQRDLSPWLE